MRDAGRIREKIEIVLDSRQVVSIVLGSAVLLGIVFYLGVTVGKDLAAAQPAPPADPLEMLDRQAEQLAEKLTFPDALTDEAAPPAPSATAAAEARQEGASFRAAADKAAAEKAAADKAAAEKAAAAALAQADAAAADRAAADEAAAKKSAARAAGEKAAADKAAANKADAGAVAVKDPPAAPKVPPAKAAVAAEDGGFTVQVGAMPNRSEADALVVRLRARGLAPYVVAADIPGKGVFYRVRLGRFETRDEAKRYLADLQRETDLPGFVAQVDG